MGEWKLLPRVKANVHARGEHKQPCRPIGTTCGLSPLTHDSLEQTRPNLPVVAAPCSKSQLMQPLAASPCGRTFCRRLAQPKLDILAPSCRKGTLWYAGSFLHSSVSALFLSAAISSSYGIIALPCSQRRLGKRVIRRQQTQYRRIQSTPS